MNAIACRIGCGACCIAPSISSPIPGMPSGKPAGVRCPQLTGENRCLLYGRPSRPAVCASYRANEEFCGTSREDAMALLRDLELRTRGGGPGENGRKILRGAGERRPALR